MRQVFAGHTHRVHFTVVAQFRQPVAGKLMDARDRRFFGRGYGIRHTGLIWRRSGVTHRQVAQACMGAVTERGIGCSFALTQCCTFGLLGRELDWSDLGAPMRSVTKRLSA